ncbi:hypothetical protein KAR91_38400 [Candidatus Pacearchaeota archaeon]|nr:hypothetical protein [Candidatus Pacearchaeota archaeon]
MEPIFKAILSKPAVDTEYENQLRLVYKALLPGKYMRRTEADIQLIRTGASSAGRCSMEVGEIPDTAFMNFADKTGENIFFFRNSVSTLLAVA